LHEKYERDELLAGIKKFEQFGWMNTIIMLASKYNYTFDEVLDLQYSVVFTVLYHNKVSADFQKRYADVLRKKANTVRPK
jgi:hypothetical protein